MTYLKNGFYTAAALCLAAHLAHAETATTGSLGFNVIGGAGAYEWSPVLNTPRDVGRRNGEFFSYPGVANMTGSPSISLPLAWSSAGLPMGMMFTSRYADEATLFRKSADGLWEELVERAARRAPRTHDSGVTMFTKWSAPCDC